MKKKEFISNKAFIVAALILVIIIIVLTVVLIVRGVSNGLIYGHMANCQSEPRWQNWTEDISHPQEEWEHTPAKVWWVKLDGMVYDKGPTVNIKRINDLIKNDKITDAVLMFMPVDE
jgi:hypothetical protein